jgi:uncharacterized protein (DUF2252 family)
VHARTERVETQAMPDPAPSPTERAYLFPRQTIPLTELRANGRTLRSTVPRRGLATFDATDRDPVEILEQQNQDRLPDLVPVRIGRMLQSAFAYYRGTAAVMANDLANEARTEIELVICGDAHVSNFGMYASPDRRMLFDLNDFDETAFGPWEWDVKRLVTSAVVGCRDRGFAASEARDAALSTARNYRLGLRRLFELTALERFYDRVETDWLVTQLDSEDQKLLRKTIKKAQKRTSDRVLASITTADDHGRRHIVDEFPIIRHEDLLDVDRVTALYDQYRLTVHTDVALLLEQFHVEDAVRRIVGVGSVGTRCSIVLLIGPADEPLFIQVKEAPPSVLETYGHLREVAPATAADGRSGREGWRVVAGQRVLQASSDPFLGWIRTEGRDYYCRQFRDMKGSIELDALNPAQYASYGGLCGAVLARAHAQSPFAGMIAGYLGNSARFDEAVTTWAEAYADQIERDYEALVAAVRAGRVPAEEGV